MDLGMREFLEPQGAFLFVLEVDKRWVAHFNECSGIKNSTEVVEIQEGGLNQRVHKLPGQSRWENIVLKYGMSSDTYMIEWRNEILNDQFSARRNASIIVLDNDLSELRRFNITNAWPVSYEGPSLAAAGSELAIETVEIAHEGVEVELPGMLGMLL
jgi:phage tail-like protein